MARKPITGLAASFDLESLGLDPMYGALLCGVVKPWGEEPKVFRMKRASNDDSKLVRELVEELEQYSILIAHNGLFHDRRYLNARALKWQLPVLDPRGKLIDPCQVARRNLNLRSNSLDTLAAYLGLEDQKMHLPPEVWVKAAIDHHEPSMKTLVERCVSDVVILEELSRRTLALVGQVNFWGSA